jgi:hypothetical protein
MALARMSVKGIYMIVSNVSHETQPLDTSEESGVLLKPKERFPLPAELITLAETPFTAAEKKLVQAMTAPDSTIEVVVPTDINSKDWTFATSVTCRVLLKAQLQAEALMPVLGRLLIIAKTTPAIYADTDHKGFEEFIQAEVRDKWGISRSTCYEAVRQAEFSIAAKLTTDDVKAIGRVKMRELTKLVPEGDEAKADTKKLIEKAKEMPIAEFREHLDKKFHVEPGSTTGAWIRFGASKATAKMWAAFVADPDIQAYAGTGDASKILKKMMEECGTEWRAQGSAKSKEADAAD